VILRDLRRRHTLEGYPVHGVICVDQDRVQRTDRDWEDFVDALTLDRPDASSHPSGPMGLPENSLRILALDTPARATCSRASRSPGSPKRGHSRRQGGWAPRCSAPHRRLLMAVILYPT
jgi:hypothetical protein